MEYILLAIKYYFQLNIIFFILMHYAILYMIIAFFIIANLFRIISLYLNTNIFI
jgi:hypothetical protein